MIELSEAQRLALAQSPGLPLEVVDPHSRQVYVLVPVEQYQREAGTKPGDREDPPIQVPPLIAQGREAFRRDLPELLRDKKLRGKFIAYSGDERIGIAKDDATLIRECIRRGIADDQYYLGVIEPQTFEEEEIECGLLEFDED